jgi:hypothetical protein
LIETDGPIDVIPCLGLTATQIERLLAAAVQVWVFGRICLTGWYFQFGIGWIVDVKMRYPAFSGRRRDAARAMLSAEGVWPLVFAGSSDPSVR